MQLTRENVESIVDQGVEFKSSDLIGEGWEYFNKNAGSSIGFFWVTAGISWALGQVPILGALIRIVSDTALGIGYYTHTEKNLKGGTVTFNDFFDGFRDTARLWQAVLANLVIGLLFLPLGVVLVLSVYVDGGFDSINLEYGRWEYVPGVLPILVLCLVVIATFVFAILFSLVTPMIVLGKMKAMDAIWASRKIAQNNFGGIFVFLLLLLLINIGGLIPCGLGLMATVPLSVFSMYFLFQHICGDFLSSGFESQLDEFGSEQKDINLESQEPGEDLV